MSKTRAEFVDQCLLNLGILVPGQSTSAENVQRMDGFVDPAFALLSSLNIYYVQDGGSAGPIDGAIEDEAFLPLADWVANKAATAFNLAADAKLQALAMIAEDTLKTISAPARTLRTLRVDPALTVPRIGTYRGGIW
jgi:hypothetical protein